ncbi:MAG: hypothetical protein LBG63_00680 [Candidatus Methanoplasma sp.]|jgi:hypothetical protein|nr:hypothetical protein [Candidatus Methanoplasma sp.]
MASKKKDISKDDKKGYQPKAAARHAKMMKTKQDEIEALQKKIETDKYLAKKYESSRKTEIKALPKEDRAAAKAELKESIAKRKEAEEKDKEKLRAMIQEEKREKVDADKEHFDDEAWVSGGKKKAKKGETSEAKTETETVPEDVPGTPETQSDAQTAPDKPSAEPVPEPKKKS